jgi:GNAT superfamily N-acetyltransferase
VPTVDNALMVHIRRATPADAMAVADVHIHSWRVGYRGLIPQDFLDELSIAEQASRYAFATDEPTDIHTLVAVDGSAICGHVTVGPSRDPDQPDIGEVWSLYVAQPHWGTGVAQVLFAAGIDALVHAGHGRALLWVMAANSRARRFYESAGWRPDGAARIEVIGGYPVAEVRYARAFRV